MFEDILDKQDWTREEKVLLYVIMELENLAKMGLVTEGPLQIVDMEKAKEVIGDIIPTGDEIEEVMYWMKSEGYIGSYAEEETEA